MSADLPAGSIAVAILADDLIWGTRLATTVDGLPNARALRLRTLPDFEAWLASAERSTGDAAIVDLTARAYDGVAAIELAHAAGCRVLAVGQHDDLALGTAAGAGAGAAGTGGAGP
jgi:hypothetical protein